MRIILDWCDWTGKTTLINFLKEKLWWDVIKTSQPKTQYPYREYRTIAYNTKWRNYLFDRMRIGECIYWPIYRKWWLSKKQIEKMFEVTKWDIYIITHTDNKNIKKIFQERWEPFTQEKDINDINWFFKKFYDTYHLENTMFLYDFKKDGKDMDSFFQLMLPSILLKSMSKF